jgi:hypothetical protein
MKPRLTYQYGHHCARPGIDHSGLRCAVRITFAHFSASSARISPKSAGAIATGSHDEDTWSELDKLLLQRWRHPRGGVLKADAAVVDAGDSGVYDVVLKFCNARMSRRVLAGKGAAGFGRPLIQASKTRRGRLFIVGVDAAKRPAGGTLRAEDRRQIGKLGPPKIRLERESGAFAQCCRLRPARGRVASHDAAAGTGTDRDQVEWVSARKLKILRSEEIDGFDRRSRVGPSHRRSRWL